MEPSHNFDILYYSYSSDEIVGGVYSIPIVGGVYYIPFSTVFIGSMIVRMQVGEMGTKTGFLGPLVGYVQTRVKEWFCIKGKKHEI